MIPTSSRDSLPQPAQVLPRTVEGARQRYLRNYTTQFRGRLLTDRTTLIIKTEEKIQALQLACPRFYEKNLPILLNQVASRLLTYDTKTPSGCDKFHDTHMRFLKILDALKTSQPAGEINFDHECDAQKERETIKSKVIKLRNELDELEATEIDTNDLGYEEGDPTEKLFKEIESKRAELFQQTYLLSRLDGEKSETLDEVHFELRTNNLPNLECLSKQDLTIIEKEIIEFLKKNVNNKTTVFGAEDIDVILRKIDLTPYNFTKNEDLKDLKSDILKAYRNYFRMIESRYREEYHCALINNPSLRPKEGIILEDEVDVPEEVEEILQENNRVFRQRENEIIKEHLALQRQEMLQKNPGANPDDDNLLAIVEPDQDDDEGDEDSDRDDPLREAEERAKQEMKLKESLYVRVKEERKYSSSDDDSNDVDKSSYIPRQLISPNQPSTSNACYTNGDPNHHPTNGHSIEPVLAIQADSSSNLNGSIAIPQQQGNISMLPCTSSTFAKQESTKVEPSNGVVNPQPGSSSAEETGRLNEAAKRESTGDNHQMEQPDKKPKMEQCQIDLNEFGDDDIHDLGVVEPQAKIPDVITID